MLVVLLLAAAATVVAAHESGEEKFVAVDRDPNTKLVFVGTRHGNRNPGQFVKGAGDWGKEGENELTTVRRKLFLSNNKRCVAVRKAPSLRPRRSRPQVRRRFSRTAVLAERDEDVQLERQSMPDDAASGAGRYLSAKGVFRLEFVASMDAGAVSDRRPDAADVLRISLPNERCRMATNHRRQPSRFEGSDKRKESFARLHRQEYRMERIDQQRSRSRR